ncbi:MAG: hypothetical protein ACRDV0_05275 [Acidimicrobiales bacterium]
MNTFKTVVVVLFCVAVVFFVLSLVAFVFSALHFILELVLVVGLGYLVWHHVFRHRGSKNPQ